MTTLGALGLKENPDSCKLKMVDALSKIPFSTCVSSSRSKYLSILARSDANALARDNGAAVLRVSCEWR